MNEKIKMPSLLLQIIIVIFVTASFLYLFSRIVPFNMGEFSYYHVLACHYYPLNMLNEFWESCTIYDIAPFSGYYLPLRERGHQGSFSSLLYLPLFLLWPSPYSARLLGLILLMIQAYYLAGLFKINLVISYIFILTYMPYTFLHACDIGPVSFHTTSIILIFFLTHKWLNALEMNRRTSWAYPSIIGLLVFLCIWMKLSYFAVLPGIVCLITYQIVIRRGIFTRIEKLKALYWHIVILLTIAVVLSLIIFNSHVDDEHKFFEYLFEKLNLIRFAPSWGLLKYFISPITNTHKVFDVRWPPIINIGFASPIIIIAILILGARKLYLKRIRLGFVVLNASFFNTGFILYRLLLIQR